MRTGHVVAVTAQLVLNYLEKLLASSDNYLLTHRE